MEFLDDITNENLHTVGLGLSRDQIKFLITKFREATQASKFETEIPIGEEGAEIVFFVHPETRIET